jgi:hypothetical protein
MRLIALDVLKQELGRRTSGKFQEEYSIGSSYLLCSEEMGMWATILTLHEDIENKTGRYFYILSNNIMSYSIIFLVHVGSTNYIRGIELNPILKTTKDFIAYKGSYDIVTSCINELSKYKRSTEDFKASVNDLLKIHSGSSLHNIEFKVKDIIFPALLVKTQHVLIVVIKFINYMISFKDIEEMQRYLASV